MRGYFIVIEGPDGVGKSVQAALLRAYLDTRGCKVVLTKEPTKEGSAASKIREVLSRNSKADPYELQRLFAEDRRNHLETVIKPALARGKTVISDRYFFSSFAYGSLECDLEKIVELNKDFPIPDLTIVLSASPEVCVDRMKKRGDKSPEFFEEAEKLKKVTEVYKSLMSKFPNMQLIDSEEGIESIHQRIISLLPENLGV